MLPLEEISSTTNGNYALNMNTQIDFKVVRNLNNKV